jgi:phospholipase/carboxylesterase
MRRAGLVSTCLASSLAFLIACDATMESTADNNGRLTARPFDSRVGALAQGRPGGVTSLARGEQRLGLDARRDGVLFVPASADALRQGSGQAEPMPLLVLLHGAGGTGDGVLRRIRDAAEEARVAVLAPDSRESTWDAVRVGFGADVAFIDRALARAFETLPVDPARVAIGGFSDGATYALSLGLVNGDLFQRIVAFSPGFLVGGLRVGKPLVFISHGTSDQILPIDRTSLMILPGLRQRGYDVTFHEFDGGHEVPPAIAKEGVAWVKNSSSPPR